MPAESNLTGAFSSLTEVLHARARDNRSLTHIDGEHDERVVSYAELHERALGILYHLQRRGLKPGDPVILYCKDNEQFIDAFWACVYGGAVPVPVAVGISDEHRRKLLRIFALLDQPWVYTEEDLFNRVARFVADHRTGDDTEALRSRLLLVEQIENLDRAGAVQAAGHDDLAFIQFSSGSTADPKGVMLSHGNLLSNIEGMMAAGGFCSDDTSLSWMPLSHDMGLIGFHLMFVAANANSHIMPTDLFVRRPLLWLLKTAEKRATALCSPNFGYQHLLKVLASRGMSGSPDLSCVRVICNGAEPIDAALCDRFLGELAGYGLPASSMFTVYGLAEASLCVTMPEKEQPFRRVWLDGQTLALGESARPVQPQDAGALCLPVLGKPIPHCELRIAAADGTELTPGRVGHILIRGANVTRGYYRNRDATRDAFRPDGWLDTGDIGVLINGELLITGRAKDILFVHGQNFYPHDLERLVQHEPGLELGKVAIAGAYRPNEPEQHIVMFVVWRQDLDAFMPLAGRARRLVNEQSGVEISEVIPVQRLPKTTSGKLQRGSLAAAWVAGEYDDVRARLIALAPARSDSATVADSVEQSLLEICNTVITDKPVGPEDDLFELGTSSLALAEIYERIDELYPDRIDITDMFDYPTIRILADRLRDN